MADDSLARTSGRDPAGPAVAFFDVDGTLTYRAPGGEPTNVPHQRVQDALRAFAARGGIPVLSTGRGMVGVGPVLRALPFRGYVTLDGTHVELDDQVILDVTIPDGLLHQAVDEMCRVGMSALFESTDAWAILDLGDHVKWGVGDVVGSYADLAALHPGERYGKVDFTQASLQAYRSSDFLRQSFTFYDVGDGYYELAMPGTSKGRGAQALLDALAARGVVPSCVYAFGDSENDASVLEVADVAVVMGQASDTVKALADYVTDSAHDDGVATGLEHFGLV